MTRDRGKRIDRRKFLVTTSAGVAGATLMTRRVYGLPTTAPQ